jgi:DNA-binding GntR family transcriptional regulator
VRILEGEAGMSETKKALRVGELFAQLKQRILHWEYPPGYRFTEDEICKEFGVSRSPVREVLRMLVENDLVDKVPYRGCTVKQPDLQAINELYDVRLILELAVVEQLATRGTPAEPLNALRARWQELMPRRLDARVDLDSAALADQDRGFHEQLAQATGNQTLGELLHTLNDRLHFIRMTDITTPERLLDTCRQHLAILEHIVAGDADAARQAMRANIEGARDSVYAALKEAVAQAYLSQRAR